jgi:hypothetical protein
LSPVTISMKEPAVRSEAGRDRTVMTRWLALLISTLLSSVVTCAGSRGLAEERPCASMAVDVDARVAARWPGLIRSLREAFESRDDTDSCARVHIYMNQTSPAVEVVLQDGRSAIRRVSRRADVEPTLTSLLVLPARSEQAAPSESPRLPTTAANADQLAPPTQPPSAAEAPTSPAVAAIVWVRAAPPAPPTPPRESSARSLGLDFALETGGRVGDRLVSLGLGALSLVEIAGVLIGVEGRIDRYAAIGGDRASVPALSLGALVGYRHRFGSMALDFTAGPGLAMSAVSQSSSTSSVTPTGMVAEPMRVSESRPNDRMLPRLSAAVHLNFSERSLLHTFVGVDGQVGATGAAASPIDNRPPLPAWTLGLALGAMVGTR